MNVAAEEQERVTPELGVIEELYYGSSPFVPLPSEEDQFYRAHVRLLFYSDDGRWRSYEPLLKERERLRTGSLEFWKRRKWYYRRPDGTEIPIYSEGSIYVVRFDTAAHTLLSFDAVPPAERTMEFAGWIGYPVRAPEVVSTLPGTHAATELESTEMEGAALPKAVFQAFYQHLQSRLTKGISLSLMEEEGDAEKFLTGLRQAFGEDAEKSGESSGLLPFEPEIRATIKETRRYSLPENINLYEITWWAPEGSPEKQVNWHAYEPPFAVCEDQETGELWPLGLGLTLFAHGDYNRDGSNEYIFWLDRYNWNGYLLATTKLRHVVTYSWTYH